jgi:glycosyltransferase involved in cell wall biosynthesis
MTADQSPVMVPDDPEPLAVKVVTSYPRVLLISADTVGPMMAGSGIRYWNLARVIGAQQSATLATPVAPGIDAPPGVQIVPYGPGTSDERGKSLAALVEQHDVVIAQLPPYLYTSEEILDERYLVIDLYAPWMLEKLEYARIDPDRGEPHRADDVEILNRLLALGDFYVCASERQRDFWLGALTAAGRLDLELAGRDPELRSLIDLTPFGLPDSRPIPNGPGPRQRFPEIGASDPVILWNGGIWNWLDPLTAIHATRLVVDAGVPARLVFMGSRSPGHEVARMELVERASQLACDLGLLDTHVFFHDWVPYDERQNWLLQSSLTLSLHQPTLESRFAYRTRALDNLWCRVPIIATEGDVLADLVAGEHLGAIVPPGNPRAVAAAVLKLLDRDVNAGLRRGIAALARNYTWERVAEPLLRYCREPWRSRGRADAPAEYVHKLERLYTETAEYARSLERAVAEKDASLRQMQAEAGERGDPWRARLRIRRDRA